MQRVRPVLRRVSDGARDILFPPRCVGCGELLPPFASTPVVLCPACRAAWDEARMAAAEGAAHAAEQGHAYLVHYRSGHTDGIPERLIYHLKHEGDPRTFRAVAAELRFPVQMAIRAATSEAGDRPPLFTYPPRSRAAVNQDGFDQAARLSRALARTCGGEAATLLRRTRRPSREQKRLDAAGRKANAAHAYALSRHATEIMRGRTVVLCDDICTTGATLAACEALLYDAGAATVVWVTVARTADT